MVKPSYSRQGFADANDFELHAMIALKAVPKDCLKGGLLVRKAFERSIDPCLTCIDDDPARKRCGGRKLSREHEQRAWELAKDAAPREKISSDYSGARRLVRLEQIARLNDHHGEKLPAK